MTNVGGSKSKKVLNSPKSTGFSSSSLKTYHLTGILGGYTTDFQITRMLVKSIQSCDVYLLFHLDGQIVYPLVNVNKKTMERSTMLSMGKSTISMVIFNSKLLNYQRVILKTLRNQGIQGRIPDCPASW